MNSFAPPLPDVPKGEKGVDRGQQQIIWLHPHLIKSTRSVSKVSDSGLINLPKKKPKSNTSPFYWLFTNCGTVPLVLLTVDPPSDKTETAFSVWGIIINSSNNLEVLVDVRFFLPLCVYTLSNTENIFYHQVYFIFSNIKCDKLSV